MRRHRKGRALGHKRIGKVLIVGGGTAGWMAASILLRTLGKGYRLQLVESDDIGTVGVGEATIPSIRNFNLMCGIDEDDFVRATQATFKLGIEFKDWGAEGEAYIHGFGVVGRDTGLVDFHHYWVKQHLRGKAGPLADYTVSLQACAHNKFARPTDAEKAANPMLGHLAHAFHFDAGLFARFLRQRCEALGVQRTEGRIGSVQTDPGNGFVRSVTLDDGSVHEADFFIDCSGFRGLLIEQTLHSGYEDWSEWLPCDSALAVPCESVRPLLPYTRATARQAGWQWRIPLQSRIGNGHVYCSRYLSQDEATATLLKNLDGPALAEPRLLRFVTGRRRKFWNKNVVAIGLASGFLEPLESTSIHLIQSALLRLVRFFPNREFDEADADEYNRQQATEFEQIRDFIILHYHANRRPGAFWQRCREMAVPQSLQHKMALFKANARLFRHNNELFGEGGWLQVMVGQGLRPRGYDPLVDNTDEDAIAAMMANLKAVVADTARRMPTHEDFITRHCKAAPMAAKG
jgi:tryptophan halogenase